MQASQNEQEQDANCTSNAPGWQPIETAPKDGTRFIGRSSRIGRAGHPLEVGGKLYYTKRRTWFGKASHVPLYGWCWGRVEDVDLWQPTHWAPAS